MDAEQFMDEALGGNKNIGTLKPLAWHELMEAYARHKIIEAQAASTNKAMPKCSCGKQGVSALCKSCFDNWLECCE